MSRFLLRVLVTGLAVLLASALFPDAIRATDADGSPRFLGVLLFALVLGVLNALLRPILFVLTLPLTVLTLGLFTLVINALVFWIAAIVSAGSVEVSGFGGAFLGALVVSVVSFVASRAIR